MSAAAWRRLAEAACGRHQQRSKGWKAEAARENAVAAAMAALKRALSRIVSRLESSLPEK